MTDQIENMENIILKIWSSDADGYFKAYDSSLCISTFRQKSHLN